VNRTARQTLLVILITWLALAGYILGRFSNDAFPSYYLYRPLLAAIPFAIVIGLLARWLVPSQAVLVASGAALALAFYSYWDQFLIPLLIGAVVLLFAWRRKWLPALPASASTAATVFVVVFVVTGAWRAAITFEPSVEPVTTSGSASGPNLYVILLDGYPRADTLAADFGIDNSGFEADLAGRGFDIYSDSLTDRRYTDYTLLAMLRGTTDGVPPDSDTTTEGQWDLRHELSLAPLPIAAQEAGYEYWIVDSPAGFVTFSAGSHIQNGGINTLEEHMLAASALAPLVKVAWPNLPTDSLRDHFEASIGSVVELAEPDTHKLVFAHIFEPHLPFLWDDAGAPRGVPDFWPRQSLFVWQIEHVGMTAAEFGDLLAGDLAHLNPRVLEMVDAISDSDPNAVVVLFGDHGARYSLELTETEWHRNFMAALTPGHPHLFGTAPSPTDILRTLLETYVPDAELPSN
jgi:hypothetical protein